MINLIPPAGYTKVRKEYMLRMLATYFLLLSAVLILLTVALIPTYVLVRAQMNDSVAHDKAGEEDTTVAQIESEITRTQGMITEFKKRTTTPDMSVFIHAIEKSAPSGIVFKNFTLGYTKNKITPIQLQGTAERREDLVAFKQALEKDALFASATVPIADLARERDVPFTMTITVATPKP